MLLRLIDIHGGSLAARAQLRRLLPATGPVVLGPWSSEVGFELLYWIHSCAHCANRGLWDPQQAIAISRGGVAQWYADLAARYVDLHELFPADEVVAASSPVEGAGRKQMSPSAFDREAVRRAAERFDLPARVSVVHPWLMYRRFRPVWVERSPVERLLRQLAFRRLQKPDAPPPVELPARYVAVKAYSSGVLPASGAGASAFAGLVDRLAARTEVVLLHTGLELDEHRELDVRQGAAPGLTGKTAPERNLADQAAVVAGADQLLCTYGGFAYLGALLGVPTVGVYEQERFGMVHHRVAHAMVDTLRADGSADLTAVNADALEQLADHLTEPR